MIEPIIETKKTWVIPIEGGKLKVVCADGDVSITKFNSLGAVICCAWFKEKYALPIAEVLLQLSNPGKIPCA